MLSSREILNARQDVVEAVKFLRLAENKAKSCTTIEFNSARNVLDNLATKLAESAGYAMAREDDEAGTVS